MKIRLLIFVMFILLVISLFADNEVYKIDNGHIMGSGITKDKEHLLASVSFSFECSFEQGTDKWNQRNESRRAGDLLSIELGNYIDKCLFPKYTLQELKEILLDEKSTLFLDDFKKYIKDRDFIKSDLIVAIEVTSLKMIPK